MNGIWRSIRGVAAHERAVANARTACTELSRRRVERDEVDLFLERYDDPGGRTRRAAARAGLAG